MENHELLNAYTDTLRDMQRAYDYARIIDIVFSKEKDQKEWAEERLKDVEFYRQEALKLGEEILARMRT